MNYGTQVLIAWMMFKDWLQGTFGSGIMFPTAPGANYNYVK
jgi:hypothetical protein